VQADSSLVDAKIFQVTEEKIKQLEKERALKDELITKKNKFNYVLIGSVVLMLILLGLIVKALFSIKTKNKKIALQSLRREMNPHFIFNSLNSVNQFIAQNNELEANKYLTSYSNLMRNMMESSNKDFITLANELEQIKKYLDLEHLRFQDKFDYEIVVDEKIEIDAVLVPNMLIQPHLENAIWHGLRYRETKGKLKVTFTEENQLIKVLIEDDGIGLEKSTQLKTKNQKVSKQEAIEPVSKFLKEEKIEILNGENEENFDEEMNNKVEDLGDCIVCLSGLDEDKLLICEKCRKTIHTYCSIPNITEIPEEDYFCNICLGRDEFNNENDFNNEIDMKEV